GRHQQPDLPMSGMVAQGNGSTIGGANAALGAEDQELLAAQARRFPAHAGILAQSKQIAAGPFAQHLVAERQLAGRPSRPGLYVKQAPVAAIEQIGGYVIRQCHGHSSITAWSPPSGTTGPLHLGQIGYSVPICAPLCYLLRHASS